MISWRTAKIIFKTDDDAVRQEIMKRGALLRDIPDATGNSLLTVAAIPEQKN